MKTISKYYFKEGDKIIGDNTDIGGFEKKLSLKYINYDLKIKKILF